MLGPGLWQARATVSGGAEPPRLGDECVRLPGAQALFAARRGLNEPED